MDASVGQGALSGAGSMTSAGAVAGATIGSVVPGVGTAFGAVVGGAIGAVVGGIAGGIGGAFSGKKKKKAKRYARMAAALQKQREEEAYKQSFLSQVRSARIARASALASIIAAGTEEGSGAQGALSSYGSQTANIVEYLSVDRGRAVQAAKYAARAKKNMSTASAIDKTTSGLIDLGGAIAKAGASAYAASQIPTEADKITYGNPNSPYAYNTNYNPNYMLPPIKPDNL